MSPGKRQHWSAGQEPSIRISILQNPSELNQGQAGILENGFERASLQGPPGVSRDDCVTSVGFAAPNLVTAFGRSEEDETHPTEYGDHLAVRDGGKPLSHLRDFSHGEGDPSRHNCLAGNPGDRRRLSAEAAVRLQKNSDGVFEVFQGLGIGPSLDMAALEDRALGVIAPLLKALDDERKEVVLHLR